MADYFENFVKNRNFLVCVDSDGCAMDTMDIKHIRCFGPCMVDEWGLEARRDEILSRWNEINLYTMTRGINRFKGLAMALEEIRDAGDDVGDIEPLKNWVANSPELSNDALKRAIDESGKEDAPESLRKALSWSVSVNQSIARLPQEDKKPFEGVERALARAHQQADVAVVSSANLAAVLEEWDLYGLLEHTDIVLAQDAGSKAHCIAELMKKGYAPDHILMCGDAPGDLDAAQRNGVFYYPIRVKHEAESWEMFSCEALNRFLDGTYAGKYQQQQIDAFRENLGEKVES